MACASLIFLPAGDAAPYATAFGTAAGLVEEPILALSRRWNMCIILGSTLATLL